MGAHALHTHMSLSGYYSLVPDGCTHESMASNQEPYVQLAPGEQQSPRIQPSATAQATPCAFESLDAAREQINLFRSVLEAHGIGEASDLLEELRGGLARTQAELHSRITVAHDEDELMECLGVNERIDKALTQYEKTTKSRISQQSKAEPKADNTLEELRDLLGPPSQIVTAAPRIPVQPIQTQPVALVKTRSTLEFEEFFAQQSTVVFSPRTPI